MMSTRGTLQDIALADLIQQVCHDRKTAQLTLSRNGDQAALYFHDGNVVHATLGGASGEEVVFQVLNWNDGQFALEPGVSAPATSIRRSWSSLLLEGARRLDEAKWEDALGDTRAHTNSEVKHMELDNVLKEMGEQVEGFVAAAVVGMDGMNIAQITRSKKADPELISAQMTMFIKLVDTTVTKMNAGVIEDNLLTTENAYLLIRFLKDRNYYLGIAADRKMAQVGNMRLNSRIYADRLAKAMPH